MVSFQWLTITVTVLVGLCVGNVIMLVRERGAVGDNNMADTSRALVVHQLIDLLVCSLLFGHFFAFPGQSLADFAVSEVSVSTATKFTHVALLSSTRNGGE